MPDTQPTASAVRLIQSIATDLVDALDPMVDKTEAQLMREWAQRVDAYAVERIARVFQERGEHGGQGKGHPTAAEVVPYLTVMEQRDAALAKLGAAEDCSACPKDRPEGPHSRHDGRPCSFHDGMCEDTAANPALWCRCGRTESDDNAARLAKQLATAEERARVLESAIRELPICPLCGGPRGDHRDYCSLAKAAAAEGGAHDH